MKHNTFLITALLLLSVSIYAQEAETDGNKTNKIEGTEKVDSPQATGDKVRIKDGTTTLIEITNEGSAGSIMLPSVGSVLSGSKLYSNGVNLFWGNSQLNGSNGATKINDLSDAKSDSDGSDDGSSLFLGVDAGLNDDGTNNSNVGIGFNALYSNTTGLANTANGKSSMNKNTTGHDNTSVGLNSLYSNTTGFFNTANGSKALFSNETGHSNTANGVLALYSNKTGFFNTANGVYALYSNTTGKHNTANGVYALYFNKTGNNGVAVGYGSQRYANNISTAFDNTNTSVGYESLRGSLGPSNNTGQANSAFGYQALYSNTTGNFNTANGSFTLYDNTTGNHNTANGYLALRFSEIGSNNTANGSSALRFNQSGSNNTANGYNALLSNITGIRNTACGSEALYKNLHGDYNTAIGYKTLYNNTGKWNTAVGRQALEDVTTGTGNIGIGYDAQVPSAAGSYQVRIGNSQISYAGIQKAWSITSDKIWKEQIRELPYGLDMLMKLKPVDYIRKNSEDRTREMGFIAQDMEEVLTNINYDDQGFLTKDDEGHLNLRYNDMIALLTKGMQEQQEMIKELKMQNEEIRRQNLELVKRQSKIESLLEREEVTQARKKELSRLMN